MLQLEDILEERKKDMKANQQRELDRLKEQHESNIVNIEAEHKEKVGSLLSGYTLVIKTLLLSLVRQIIKKPPLHTTLYRGI